MPTKKSKSIFVDIDDCKYKGCRATPTKYIARVELPDGNIVNAWSDDKPSFKMNDVCAVNHAENSDVYNLWS
jgi:hypothetical protein